MKSICPNFLCIDCKVVLNFFSLLDHLPNLARQARKSLVRRVLRSPKRVKRPNPKKLSTPTVTTSSVSRKRTGPRRMTIRLGRTVKTKTRKPSMLLQFVSGNCLVILQKCRKKISFINLCIRFNTLN